MTTLHSQRRDLPPPVTSDQPAAAPVESMHRAPTRDDDIWGFHGQVIQRNYDASLRYAEEHHASITGNTFGAQPPRKE